MELPVYDTGDSAFDHICVLAHRISDVTNAESWVALTKMVQTMKFAIEVYEWEMARPRDPTAKRQRFNRSKAHQHLLKLMDSLDSRWKEKRNTELKLIQDFQMFESTFVLGLRLYQACRHFSPHILLIFSMEPSSIKSIGDFGENSWMQVQHAIAHPNLYNSGFGTYKDGCTLAQPHIAIVQEEIIPVLHQLQDNLTITFMDRVNGLDTIKDQNWWRTIRIGSLSLGTLDDFDST
ncbi:hypothetical protein BT69DRAFT_87456 [Atractiella rhizophila]|nr:hypothetical protein BT69DRAFT_87456 [Atractiella rhizophila]